MTDKKKKSLKKKVTNKSVFTTISNSFKRVISDLKDLNFKIGNQQINLDFENQEYVVKKTKPIINTENTVQ